MYRHGIIIINDWNIESIFVFLCILKRQIVQKDYLLIHIINII